MNVDTSAKHFAQVEPNGPRIGRSPGTRFNAELSLDFGRVYLALRKAVTYEI